MTLKLLVSSLRFDKGLSGFCQNLLMGPLQSANGAGVWLARLNSSAELEVEGESNILGLNLLGIRLPLMGASPLAIAVRARGLVSSKDLPEEWLDGKAVEADFTYSAFPIQQDLRVRGSMMIVHGGSRKDLEVIRGLSELLEIIVSLSFDYQRHSDVRVTGKQLLAPQRLTERQLMVISGLQLGLTNYQVARNLNVSESTVKHETLRIYRFLGVYNRVDAVAAGIATGLIEPLETEVNTANEVLGT